MSKNSKWYGKLCAWQKVVVIIKYYPKRENIFSCIKEQEEVDSKYETEITGD